MKIEVAPEWAWMGASSAAFAAASSGAHDRRSHGHDAAALAAGPVDGFGGFGGNRVPFAVQVDLVDPVDPQGSKGA